MRRRGLTRRSLRSISDVSSLVYATHQTESELGSTRSIYIQMHVKVNIPSPHAGSTVYENNKCCTRDKNTSVRQRHSSSCA